MRAPSHARRGASAVAGLLALAFAAGCGRAHGRPSIVLVVVDTLRADHLDWYGYARPTTKGLERLRADGMLFEAAYAPHPETTPAIASLLTGLDPPKHGVRGLYQRLHPANRTLAEILSEEGYQTAAFVSSFVMIRDFSGLDQGFEVYDDFVTERERNRENFERRASATLALAREFVEQRDDPRPLFLFLHLIDPHGPYTPPAPWDQRFQAVERVALAGSVPRYQKVPGADDLSAYLDLYDGEIGYVAESLGRFLDFLAVSGQYASSLVVFTADHGESFGERGIYLRHGDDVYQENIRVPLLVKLPRATTMAHGGSLGEPVGLVDLLPTILEAVGLESRPELDGVSLVPAIERRPLARPPVRAWSRPGQATGFARIAGATKWMLAPGGDSGQVLRFDLLLDPGERQPASETGGAARELNQDANVWLETETPFEVEVNVLAFERRGEFVRERLSRRDREALERLRSLGYVQ